MASAATANEKYVNALLMNNNTSKYYIEHHIHKSSHVAHGLVALDRLGASNERMEQFLSFYPDRLEAPNGETAQTQETSETDPVKLLGQMKGYYTVLQYYKYLYEKRYASDVDKLIRGELPKLHRGMVGAATHGTIQAGYGYAARCDPIVIEGLAYIHHSYIPISVSEEGLYLGRGQREITDVLEDVRKDEELQGYIRSEEAKTLYNNRPFTSRSGSLVLKKGDVLAKFVSQIKVPAFDASNFSMDDVKGVCRWALDCAILVYSASANVNDFFLLHGVTAFWSLLQLLDAFEDAAAAMQAVQSAVFVLLAVYITQGSSALTVTADPASFKYPDWKDIIQAVYDGKELEVHILKLVQVLNDLSKVTSDQDKLILYKAAANIVLTNDYYRIDRSS